MLTFGNISRILSLIHETGGCTFSLSTGSFNPNDGYMVAMEKGEKVIDWPVGLIDFGMMLQEYCIIHAEDLKPGNCFLGFWVRDGKLYIDLSVKCARLSQAILAGKINHQIAIWDNENKTEINLDTVPV